MIPAPQVNWTTPSTVSKADIITPQDTGTYSGGGGGGGGGELNYTH